MLLNVHKTSVTIGALFGVLHLIWALMVLFGWAQPLLTWSFGLHFLVPIFVVTTFDWGTAVMLVVVTTAIGYVGGWILAAIWNFFHTK